MKMCINKRYMLFFFVLSFPVHLQAVHLVGEQDKKDFFSEQVKILEKNISLYVESLVEKDRVIENFHALPNFMPRDPRVLFELKKKISSTMFFSLSRAVPSNLSKAEALPGLDKYFSDIEYSLFNKKNDPIEVWYHEMIRAFPDGVRYGEWTAEEGNTYNTPFFIKEVAAIAWKLRYVALAMDLKSRQTSIAQMQKILLENPAFPPFTLPSLYREEILGPCYVIQEHDHWGRNSETGLLVEPLPNGQTRANFISTVEQECFSLHRSTRSGRSKLEFIQFWQEAIRPKRDQLIPRVIPHIPQNFSAERESFIKSGYSLYFPPAALGRQIDFTIGGIENPMDPQSKKRKIFFTGIAREVIDFRLMEEKLKKFSPSGNMIELRNCFPFAPLRKNNDIFGISTCYQHLGSIFGYAFLNGDQIPAPLSTTLLRNMWGEEGKDDLVSLLAQRRRNHRTSFEMLGRAVRAFERNHYFATKPYAFLLNRLRKFENIPYIEMDESVGGESVHQRGKDFVHGFQSVVPHALLDNLKEQGMTFTDFEEMLCGVPYSVGEIADSLSVYPAGNIELQRVTERAIVWLQEIIHEQSRFASEWNIRHPADAFASVFAEFVHMDPLVDHQEIFVGIRSILNSNTPPSLMHDAQWVRRYLQLENFPTKVDLQVALLRVLEQGIDD